MLYILCSITGFFIFAIFRYHNIQISCLKSLYIILEAGWLLCEWCRSLTDICFYFSWICVYNIYADVTLFQLEMHKLMIKCVVSCFEF